MTDGETGSVDLPRRLTHDAILEAILDVRFEYDSKRVSEIFFGRLADKDEWRDFGQSRSAVADIPESIRRTQGDLRYQPTFQLVAPDGRVSIQVGPQVFVYARRGAYPGWDESFCGELESAIDHLFTIGRGLEITRLGLRYVNALRSDVHGISGIDDLALRVSVAGKPVKENLNFSFATRTGTDFETMTRVASVERALGQIPDNTSVIVDLDVYTSDGFKTTSAGEVKDWTVRAHEKEKKSFFAILGSEATERLRADK